MLSTWDLNYGSKEKLSESDREIENSRTVIPKVKVDPKAEQCSVSDSYVDIQNQVYHEDIPIAGTDLTLNYSSDRVDGYKHLVTTKVSEATVPDALIGIIAKLEIAGRTFTKPYQQNQIKR